MTKATRILNKYQIKEMLLNTRNIDFNKFYSAELIQILEVAQEVIKEQQLTINKALQYAEIFNRKIPVNHLIDILKGSD